MVSMTGYVWREKTGKDISLSVEVKGYNSRFLEIFVNVPPWLSGLESKIRKHIASVCARGKVEVSVRLKEHNAPFTVSVNTEAAKAYEAAIASIAASLGINEKPSLGMILDMEGVLEAEKKRDDGQCWKMLEPVLTEAAAAFRSEREREGKHTEEDILAAVGIIEASLETVASFASTLEESIKKNIRGRFAEVMGNQIDENRVLAETAVLLMKYTISEEISRLSSHLAEFRAETARNPAPGKKLDFLSQEINREINTIGSKSAILEVSGAVVRMKEALENVREQLRNVE